ncbi:monooxygenase [Penicillium angulare]|uniref:Monooxygenase n=1 Tax=Penicillium angulare TaxID=116970 RepID=A0A9W9EST3_9EURO|nr:monooxygenase [Penicillium angulare]
MSAKSPKFRVVIVGGSVAGLTLAHCLWKSNIDFVVLEAYREIAPQVGASIGILANGARILDQLGMFDDVLDAVEPLQHSSFWADSGKLIMSSTAPKRDLTNSIFRHGYPINFLDRQTLLGILYAHLGECREKVLVNKKVAQITHHSTHIVAECEDGSSYQGDLVVGADGVRSSVRQQMWKYMVSQGLSKDIEPDMRTMISEYDCVFGISPETPGLIPGHTHRTFGEGYSFLTISSKNGRVYWFFFTKMDRKYASDKIPRFRPEDVDEHVAAWLHKPLTGDVPFRAVYERAFVKTHLPLEEANYRYWTKDRFVCIGDSIHKMTPNAGQGGNSAIESAATLANSLSKLLQGIPSPHTHHVAKFLQSWQNERRPRVTEISNSANDLTRLEACATLKHKVIGNYLLPYLKNVLLDKSSASIVGAANLDSVPLPPRSLRATMPYTDQTEAVDEGSIWNRLFLCMPLVVCYITALATMTPLIVKLRPFMIPFFVKGFWTAGSGETIDLQKSLYHLPFLDRLFKPLILCFLPSISGTDPVSAIQMRSFITDTNAVFAIWLLESCRSYHSSTELLLPILAGIFFQLKGIGLWAPVYYALEYLRIPLRKFRSQGSHSVDSGTTISLLLSLLVCAYVPTYMNFTASTVESRRSWNAAWQLFPVLVPALAGLITRLSKAISCRGQRENLSLSAQERSERDIFWKRVAYVSLAAISGLTWVHMLRGVPTKVSLRTIFWPGLDGHARPVTSFVEGIARFLQYDQMFSMASSFIWLVLRYYELNQAGVSFSWIGITSMLVGAAAIFGPGAAFILGWGWKEELIHCFVSSSYINGVVGRLPWKHSVRDT